MLYAAKQILSGFSGLGLLIMLVLAIRHFDANRSRWLAAFAVVLFAGISVAKLGMAYVAADTIDAAVMAIAHEPVPASRPLDQVAPEKREKYSTLLAQSAFRRTGRLQLVTDASGRQWTYAPSQQEIEQRDQLIETLAEIEASRNVLWMSFLRGIGMLLAALALSAVLVHEDRKRRLSVP